MDFVKWVILWRKRCDSISNFNFCLGGKSGKNSSLASFSPPPCPRVPAPQLWFKTINSNIHLPCGDFSSWQVSLRNDQRGVAGFPKLGSARCAAPRKCRQLAPPLPSLRPAFPFTSFLTSSSFLFSTLPSSLPPSLFFSSELVKNDWTLKIQTIAKQVYFANVAPRLSAQSTGCGPLR